MMFRWLSRKREKSKHHQRSRSCSSPRTPPMIRGVLGTSSCCLHQSMSPCGGHSCMSRTGSTSCNRCSSAGGFHQHQQEQCHNCHCSRHHHCCHHQSSQHLNCSSRSLHSQNSQNSRNSRNSQNGYNRRTALMYRNKAFDGFDSLRQVDANGVPYVIENEEQLRQMSWYQPGIPREISLEILSKQEIGSFVIRDSSSHQGCYALSVKVPKYDNPNGISNYLIVPTESGGVRLKGLDKEWPNMAALVTHHTVMKEMLPCTLTLPRNAANLAFNETEQNEREEDDDYQKLADCRTMMNDLRL